MDATHFAAIAELTDPEIDLAASALLIAQTEYPQLDVASYVRRLDEYAALVRARLPDDATPELTLGRLNQFLFEQLGFAGNATDFYDPRNSFLNDVLDRKLGIPISISIVYMEVGRRLGLPLDGVSFPGHFLVKMPLDAGTLVLDPFNAGITLDLEDLQRRLQTTYGADHEAARTPLNTLLTTATKKEILLRMLRNLKGVYVHKNDFSKALNVMNNIIALAPDIAGELRDRGVIHQALDCFRAALHDYETYLRLQPWAPDAIAINERIEQLRTQTSHLH